MPKMRVEGRADFVRLEPGRNYFWKVEEAASQYSKGGDEQINLILRVGDKNGQAKIYETLTFSDKAYFRVELFLKSAGKYPGDGVEVYFNEDDLIGLSGWCTVKYEHNEQKNRDYARIDRWVEADKQVPDRRWVERAEYNSPPSTPSPATEYESNAANEWDGEAGRGDDIPF